MLDAVPSLRFSRCSCPQCREADCYWLGLALLEGIRSS
jgi:hypothetical protein